MNRKWLENGMRSLEILMNFLAVFCAETAVFALFPVMEAAMEGSLPVPSLVRQAALVTVPFLFWQIRERAEHFWCFVGGHVLVAAAAALLLGQTPFQRFTFGVFAAGYLIRSFYARFANKDEWGNVEKAPRTEETRVGVVAAAVAGTGAFVLCAYLGNEEGCARIWRVALVFVFLFFVDAYLQNLERFVQFNRTSNAHIPVRRMLLQGGGLTAGFGLFAVVILGIGTNNALMERITAGVKRIGLWLIQVIGRAIAFLLSFFKGEGETGAVEQQAFVQPEFGVQEVTEQPFWLEILEQVVEYLILAGLAVFLCYLAYRLVAAAIRRFYESRGAIEEERGETLEIRENLAAERRKSRREKGLPFLARTPEERIRKCYRRAVQRTERFRNPEGNPGGGRKKDIWRREAQEKLVWGRTARQIGEATGLTEGERARDFWKLVSLYEKARYGTGCTVEEAKQCEKI